MAELHHSTQLLTVTNEGHVELTSDDPAVVHKARQAHENHVTITFVYRYGDVQETTTGRVVWIADYPTFRFAVEADEDDAAIVRNKRANSENIAGPDI